MVMSTNKTSQVIASTVVLMILATSAVALRLVARNIKRLSLASDDYTIILALILFYILASANFAGVRFGLGRNADGVGPKNVEMFWKTTYWGLLMYTVDIATIKISILLMYHRIFPVRRFTICLWIVGAVVVAWCVATFFATVFNCVPIRYYWDFSVPNGRCIDHKPYFTSTSLLNIVTDVVILALPVHTVLGLQMSRARKASVCAIFLLGGLVCLATGVRIYYYTRLSLADITASSADPAIWTVVETGTALTCACLPVLPPLFTTVAYRRLISTLVSFDLGRWSPFHRSYRTDAESYGSLPSRCEPARLSLAIGQSPEAWRTAVLSVVVVNVDA